jgi:hypothetical protein
MDGTIAVHSSHGSLTVDRITGQVLEIHRDDPADPDTLPEISRVDLEEHFKFWDRHSTDAIEYREQCSSIDILDVGYWVGDEYTPAEEDWRQEMLRQFVE